jgi:hypothetical protein
MNGAKLNSFDSGNVVRKIVEQIMNQYSSVHGFAPAVPVVVASAPIELAVDVPVVPAEVNPLDKLDEVLEVPELSSEDDSKDSVDESEENPSESI